MPRCSGCGGGGCGCVIVEGANVTITGAGTPESPYEVSSDGGGGGSTLTGEIKLYAGADTPTGWLVADGAPVSRSTYSALFAVIGTTYGAGDGSTTFNLPNLAGRFPLGVNSSHPRGEAAGQEAVTLLTADLPAHTHSMFHQHDHTHNHDLSHDHANATTTSNGNHHHTVNGSNTAGSNNNNLARGAGHDFDISASTDGAHQHTVDIPGFSGVTGLPLPFASTGGPTVANTGATGSGTPVATMPPYTAIRYLIRT